MRPPAKIKHWLTIEEMFQWLQNSPDEWSHKKRMAIWLTCTGKLHANKTAKTLGVSTQAVWLWIRQYNTKGPEGLERKGRGGRRWGYMSAKEETEFMKSFIHKVKMGGLVNTAIIKRAVEKKLGRKVSKPYVYHLLNRHEWSRTIAQSRAIQTSTQTDTFQKISQPWKIS